MPTRTTKYDAMRGLAALWVLLAHVDQITLAGRFELSGTAPVVIFFLLSGYLITSSMRQNVRRNSAFLVEPYLLARVNRIYPPLIGCLLVIMVLGLLVSGSRFVYTPVDLYRALNFGGGLQLVNGPLWSLNVEVQAYACAGGIAAALFSKDTTTRICGATVVGTLGWFWWGTDSLFYVLVWAIGARFALGQPRPIELLLFVLPAVGAHAFLLEFFEALGTIRPAELALAALVSWLMFVSLPAGAPRWLAWTGGWSYSLYIVHLPILLAVQSLAFAPAVRAALGLLAAIAVAVPFAAVFERSGSLKLVRARPVHEGGVNAS